MLSAIESQDVNIQFFVEYLSSAGELIQFLKKSINSTTSSSATTWLAVDLDYNALNKLHIDDPEIFCICCDAKLPIFIEGAISIAVSNSVHHLADDTGSFFKYMYKALDGNDGRFIGVESAGFLSKMAIAVISLIPKRYIPYSLKEVYHEKNLLKEWLGKTIKDRLSESSLTAEYKRISMFHTMYAIYKSRDDRKNILSHNVGVN